MIHALHAMHRLYRYCLIIFIIYSYDALVIYTFNYVV